ncbi:MAG: hypothetical protein MJE68_27540 [Proteobacteria bacterium]|nr:hypothetical protein [Pseudomonadota bacterium]
MMRMLWMNKMFGVSLVLLLAGCGGGGGGGLISGGIFGGGTTTVASPQSSAVVDLTTPFGGSVFAEEGETSIAGENATPGQLSDEVLLAERESRLSSPLINFNRQAPEDVAVAAIGIGDDLNEVFGGAFNRRMWRNSDVDEIIALLDRMPSATHSPTINALAQVMVVAEAAPPLRANNKAETYFRKRIDWLRDRGLSSAMADMVRQLPDDPKWQGLLRFLIDHNLITRRDEEACALAQSLSEQTTDLYWFQVLGFCALRNGQATQAGFQLDILEARGLSDPLFFELMRSWIDGEEPGRVNRRDIKATGINIALMDSANYPIQPDMRLAMPLALSESLSAISYTNPETSYIQNGIGFHYRQSPLDRQLARWQEIVDVPGDAAGNVARLTNLLEARADPVTIAASRVMTWWGLLSVDNADMRLDLALMALDADIDVLGGEALAIWAPHLATSVPAARNAVNRARGIRLLAIAGIAPPGVAGGQVSQAWAGLEEAVMVEESVPLSMIRLMDGYDTIPLLQRAGVAVEPLIGQDVFATRPVLASATENLPYPDALWLTQLVQADRPAEAVLMASALLGTTPLYRLTREDATRIVGALYDMGLTDESRSFALEVIRAWGGFRASQAGAN